VEVKKKKTWRLGQVVTTCQSSSDKNDGVPRTVTVPDGHTGMGPASFHTHARTAAKVAVAMAEARKA